MLLRLLFFLLTILISIAASAQTADHSSIQSRINEDLLLNTKPYKAVVQFRSVGCVNNVVNTLDRYGLKAIFKSDKANLLYVELPDNLEGVNHIEYMRGIEKADKNIVLVNPIYQSANPADIGFAADQHFFVKLKKGTDYNVLNELAQELGAIILHPYEYLENVYLLRDNNRELNTLEIALTLELSGKFEYVQPNFYFSPHVGTNDNLYERQWAIDNTGIPLQFNGTPGADMDVDSAWTITTGDAAIKIAVLDSGTDTAHADLKQNLLPGYNAIDGINDGYPYLTGKRGEAHGTACAGIIAAQANNNIGVAGVAHRCKIVPVKIFYYIDTALGATDSTPGAILNDIPYSATWWMADGLSWAWQTGDADIMSNSWGVPSLLSGLLPGSQSLVNDVMDDMVTLGRAGKGIVSLYSSGNYGTDMLFLEQTPLWPGNREGALSIGASSMCDEWKNFNSCDGEDWWQSHWGNGLHVVAPGVKVPSTDMVSFPGYTTNDYTLSFNGTSAACPNAAAVVALMLSVRPDLTFDEVKYLLGNTADKIGNYDYSTIRFAGSWSPETGYGRVNAYSAVKAALDFVEIPVGLSDEAQPTTDFVVFPNPSTGKLMVSTTVSRADDLEVSVYNSNGHQILVKDFGTLQSGQYSLSIYEDQSLPSGFYIVELNLSGQLFYNKWIVTE